MKSVCLLAADPGVSNYGYCVIQACISEEKGIERVRIHRFGRLHTTVRSLVGVEAPKGIKAYAECTEELRSTFGVDAFIAERFQTRGNGGPTIELISSMLGVTCLQMLSNGCRTRLIIASQWKTAFGRNCGSLEEVYLEAKKAKITPHEVDAFCIGLYGLYLMVNRPAFTGISSEKVINTLLKYIASRMDIGTPVKKVRKKKRR